MRARWLATAVALALACGLPVGCGGAEEEASSVEVDTQTRTPEDQTRTLIGRLRATVTTVGAVDVGSPRATRQLEKGWHPGEGSERDGHRAWAKSREASLWMVVDEPRDSILWVRAAPPAFLPGQTLSVELDGHDLGRQVLKSGMQWLAYPVRASQLEAGHRRIVLRPSLLGSQRSSGFGSDERTLAIACEWVLLTPRDVQPAKRLAELRERESRRRTLGALGLLPGDFAHLTFRPGEVDRLELEHEGGQLEVELLERGTGRAVWHESAGGAGTRTTRIDLEGESGELSLNLAVLADSEPVALNRAEATGPARPWNVVLLVVDTLRADAVLDPDDAYETPGMDRLAADAVVFPRAFAHAPMTLPSHTALFSSSLPHKSGIVNNWQEVTPELPLLSEWIQRYGYQTSAVLSLGTLWNAKRGTSVDRGFTVYDKPPNDMAKAPDTESRLRHAVDTLDPTKPFFLFAHFSDPHEPYNTRIAEPKEARLRWNGDEVALVSTSDMTVWKQELTLQPGRNEFEVESDAEFIAKHLFCNSKGAKLAWEFEEGRLRQTTTRLRAVVEHPGAVPAKALVNLWVHDAPDADERRRRYREEVGFVDRSIDAFLQHLEGHGLLDDTLIVFTSDHGEALGERGSWGHVETLKDEMIHVPLVIRPPGGHPDAEGLRAQADVLVRHIDLVPTILDLLNLPAWPRQDGTSLLERADRLLISETHRPEAARDKICLRDERYKMIFVAADAERGLEASIEMYDLEADPGELVNVFATARDERPTWPAQLEALNELYMAQRQGVELDPERLEKLKALGYMGHEDEGD